LLILLVTVWGVKATIIDPEGVNTRSETRAQITKDGDVLVPQDTLRVILGCHHDRTVSVGPKAPLPVFHTDIDTETGTTSQKVALLDTDQLKQSLRGSVHSDEVLDLIIGQLNTVVQEAAAATAAGNPNRLRQDGPFHESNSTIDDKECTINNNIDISVPAQEVDNFNDRVQMLIQQNSFLLLEQINTLFTYKLRSLREDFEGMVKDRTKKINRKLDAVLKALGAEMPAGGEDEDEETVVEASVGEEETVVGAVGVDTTEASSEVDTSTDLIPEKEQPEEDTTEEPEKETSVEAQDITRNTALRPGVLTRPRPSSLTPPSRPNRYQTRYRTRPSAAAVRPERPDRPSVDRSSVRQKPSERQRLLQEKLRSRRRRPKTGEGIVE